MPNIIYNTGIPAAPNNPSEDQPDMLVNTNNIPTLIEVDHYGFNTVDGSGGFHKQSTYQAGSDPATAAGQGAVYTKDIGGGEIGLFYINQSSTTVTQLVPGISSAGTNGYADLPGGIRLQWGLGAITGTTSTITFPVAFSAAAYNVTATLRIVSNQTMVIYITAITDTNFTVNKPQSSNLSFYWQAIGPR